MKIRAGKRVMPDIYAFDPKRVSAARAARDADRVQALATLFELFMRAERETGPTEQERQGWLDLARRAYAESRQNGALDRACAIGYRAACAIWETRHATGAAPHGFVRELCDEYERVRQMHLGGGDGL